MWKCLNLFYVKYSEKCGHSRILQFAYCKTTGENAYFCAASKKSRPDAEVTANILQYKHRKTYIYGNY